MKLPKSFYQRENVVQIAKELLGKSLHSRISGLHTAGIITEVEAYSGINDKACHANNGIRTPKTEVMYAERGCAYVYLCYGIHHLFNVVTNVKNRADAALIRAIQPIEGIDVMLERRGKAKLDKSLTSGPGTLTQALAIRTKSHTGISLSGHETWIEDAPIL